VREVARVEHTQAPVDPAGRLSFSCEAQQDDAALLLTQNVHSAPITQQAEKLSFARAERK
jgi:hypothetical protein